MKNPGRITILYLLTMAILAACDSSAPTPVISPTRTVEAATPTIIPLTGTNTPLPSGVTFSVNTVFPTATYTATASPTLLPRLDTPVPIPGGIVYYYFVDIQHIPPPGSVVAMPEALILAPAQLSEVYGSDVTADLRSALEAVLKDERNVWFGDKLQIAQLSYSAGQVHVVLEGEYYAVAPVVLSAARAQILMTLFANEAVQSARVMINGDNISNISISNSMDAKPIDYTYTRAEIESFMADNAYAKP